MNNLILKTTKSFLNYFMLQYILNLHFSYRVVNSN